MIGAVVASAVFGLLAVRTRRWFAWSEPMIALMLASGVLMLIMCSSLLVDGRWKAALFMAPLVGAVVVPAVLLGRVRSAPSPQPADDSDDDEGGGGGGRPPQGPRPCAPGPGIDWERFDELREAWGRAGSRSGV